MTRTEALLMKLAQKDKVVLHDSCGGHIRVTKYWEKTRVENSFLEDWWFDTPEEAIEKALQLKKEGIGIRRELKNLRLT